MSSRYSQDIGNTLEDAMVVSNSDEQVQAIESQNQDDGEIQENQARSARSGRPAVAKNPAQDAQGGAISNPSALALPGAAPALAAPASKAAATTGDIIVITSSAPGLYTSTTASTANQSGTTYLPGVPVGPVLQRTRHECETLTLHPTDPTKLIARFRIENPYTPGTYYEQIDEIDELDTTVTSPVDPKFYFSPRLEESKVPHSDRANKHNNWQPALWTRQPNSVVWTRPGRQGGPLDHWQPISVFRRFNLTTNKYEDIHVSLKKLENINPNDKPFANAYNKWLDQIKRRRDSEYTKIVSKDHWSPEERRALYIAINVVVRTIGLDAFTSSGVRMFKADMQSIADAVNAVGGLNRRPDAVRSQINSSHATKNKPIFDLMAVGDAMRDRLGREEDVPHGERYPDEAIPTRLFPDVPVSKKQASSTSKKRAAAHMEDTDGEPADPPADMELGSLVRQPNTRTRTRAPPQYLPSPERHSIRPNKKPRYEDPADNDLSSGDEAWEETDEETPSDAAELIEGDEGWETATDEEDE
jgi:hypothetical protein